MATVAEKFRAVSGDRSSREIGFIVKEATNESDAIDATEAYLLANYGNYRDGIPLSQVSVDEISYPKGIFETTATFAVEKPEDPQTDDIELSFNQNLDTRRIYKAIDTVAAYGTKANGAQAATVDDFNDRIGVQSDDSAEGADVRVPVGGFQVTWFAPVASVTTTYRNNVLKTVGKVNDDTFYGFDAGEVMFAGMVGKSRNADDWQLTFQFETRENRTSIEIGGGAEKLTIDSAQGWQLLWPYYAKKPDGNGEDLVYPERVYVCKVYETEDFSILGVGT